MNTGEDQKTLAFYEAEAPVYAANGAQGASRHLPDFVAALPSDAAILELGCGGGRDAEALIAAGFHVDATDGCTALAEKAAARIGQPVRVMRFEELAIADRYDGVWANACLLHVPRAGLSDILKRIHLALVPRGLFVASYKTGLDEGRDRFGRYFNYPDKDRLLSTYAKAASWASIAITERSGGGYDGLQTDWLDVRATR